MDEQGEEEEEEPSNSVPSSPKLSVRPPFSHALSHSFDDLISNVNNEIVSSPTSVSSPKSPLKRLPSPKPVHFHPLESGESGSDSDIEMTEFPTLGKKRVSATNPLSDNGLRYEDRNQSETDTERSGDERASSRPRTVSESSSGGKFAQFKGKFLQTVSNWKPPMSTLNKLRPSSMRSRLDGDSDWSASQSQSQSSRKFMSVRRRHISSSPDTSGRVRQRSPLNEPSEEELKRQKAMENSKTTFIILKAV